VGRVGRTSTGILMILAQSFQYKGINTTITRNPITNQAMIQYLNIKMTLEDIGMDSLVSLAKSSIDVEGVDNRDLYNSSY